jgi:hypothetical protein
MGLMSRTLERTQPKCRKRSYESGRVAAKSSATSITW